MYAYNSNILWPYCAHASIRGCDAIKPYPSGTKAACQVRMVSGHLIDITSARARRLGKAVNQGLMTIAMRLRQTLGLALRGHAVPKAKQPSLRASFFRRANRARRPEGVAGLGESTFLVKFSIDSGFFCLLTR
jgi:hypothetical protein